MTRARVFPLLVTAGLGVLAATTPTLALAQRDGGPAGEPAPSGNAVPPLPAPPTQAPSSDKSAPPEKTAPHAAATPVVETDGDEGDRPPPQLPAGKPAPFQRQPAVLKDGMLRIPGG